MTLQYTKKNDSAKRLSAVDCSRAMFEIHGSTPQALAPYTLQRQTCRRLPGNASFCTVEIKCHLKWLLHRVEQCQTHFLHDQRLGQPHNGRYRMQETFSQFPPLKVNADLLSDAVYQYVRSLHSLSLWGRLKKIGWAFLSGGMCAYGGGCLLASGYIRCYRRNLYCWVWDTYGNGQIRSSPVVYWAFETAFIK